MQMPPMDISDVGYDLFLIDGQKELFIPAKPGETLLFRIINASAKTYFYLQFASGKMKVVAADELDVEPFDIESILVAIAKTYDVIITVPDKGFLSLRQLHRMEAEVYLHFWVKVIIYMQQLFQSLIYIECMGQSVLQ